MQMMKNIYSLMVSCEINDAIYIVDSAKTDDYKKGRKTLVHSQLARRLQEASAPVKRTTGTRRLRCLYK
jgi:hypothetical protein